MSDLLISQLVMASSVSKLSALVAAQNQHLWPDPTGSGLTNIYRDYNFKPPINGFVWNERDQLAYGSTERIR